MKTLYTLALSLMISGASFAQGQTTTSIGDVNSETNSVIVSMGNKMMINTNESAIVTIYDITGKLVESININSTTTIDMNNYNVNTYFVKVDANGKSYVKKGILVK